MSKKIDETATPEEQPEHFIDEDGIVVIVTPETEPEATPTPTLDNTSGMEFFKCLQDAGFVTFTSGQACVHFARFVEDGQEIITVPAVALAGMSERSIKKFVEVLDPSKGAKALLKKMLAATPGVTETELLEMFRQLSPSV